MRTSIVFVLLLSVTTIANTQSIRNVKKDQHAWKKIAQEIGHHELVCLGEASHWVETYLEVKVELIKELHANHQFDALIFESGFVNAFMVYWYGLESREGLQECLYDIWQTSTTLKLFDYQTTQANQGNALRFLGCDLKGPKSFLFSRYLKQLFDPYDAEYAEALSQLDSSFMEIRGRWEPAIGGVYRGVYLSEAKADSIESLYLAALDSMQNNKELLFPSSQPRSHQDFAFSKRCLQNRLFLLDLMQLPSYQEKHQYRDSIMAENTIWLMDNGLSKNAKYVLWGADIHLSKNAKWEDMGEAWHPNRSLVEHLLEKTRKPIFSVGIKGRKLLDKSVRKRLDIRRNGIYWMSRQQPNKDLEIPFSDEHDALIICGTIRGLDKLKKP